jgi:TonB family protein
MKLPGRTSFLRVLLVLMSVAPFALSADDLETQLNSEYANKTLILRHFYQAQHLSFEPDGTLVGSAPIGPWTVDGLVFVKQIEHRHRTLKIRGRRVCVVFDSKGKPYRDVLAFLAETKGKHADKPEDFFRSKGVEIEIGLNSENANLSDAESAMMAVFLAPNDPIRDVMPDYWRSYFDKLDGQTLPPGASAETTYSTGHGVSAPRPIHQADPEYSDEARRARYQGTLTLSLVVDPSGSPRDLEIVTPLGLGLDEKAIASVGNWQFKPGWKDGEPVPVKIAVEVDFHLY